MKLLLKFSLLTLFVFIYSCNTESVISDDELIDLIINSKDKVSIAESDLPSISLSYLDKEFEDDYVDPGEHWVLEKLFRLVAEYLLSITESSVTGLANRDKWVPRTN